MSKVANELYKDFITVPKADSKANESAANSDNKLERTPTNDTFESKKVTNKKIDINKNKLIKIGIAVLGIFATAAAFLSGKNSNSKLISLQNAKIESLEQNIAELIEKNKGEERAITETIESIVKVDDKTSALKEKLVEHYRVALESAHLSYDALRAPVDTIYQKTNWAKVFTLQDIKPIEIAQKSVNSVIDTLKLKSMFMQDGKLILNIPSEKPIEAVKSKDAFINGKTIPHLGEIVDSEITTAYGKRINWSNEKIARDIMQNFYDGHGNTLDGTQVFLEKLSNGKTRIKISGKGFYEYTNLQLLGSGNKCENLYNAGGFGEGTKVLVANLLGKGDANKVTYSCADWKLSFCAPQNGSNVIQRKLEKVPEIFDGNSIEFETDNQKLVDAIIDSVNYFKHSQNPDFQKLTYDSKDFGFKFLGEGKGNIYLTQRFEFEGDGNWAGKVDGLDLIFKRKPDAIEYKKLIGSDLPKDRDRTSLTFEDVQNLTRYFAHNMSDKDLMSAIVSTKPMWGKIDYGSKTQSALKSFLEGLIEEASIRKTGTDSYKIGLKLDLGQERFAAVNPRMNETVRDTLSGYDYKFLPEFFKKIGIDEADDIFKKLSIHTPIEPNEIEVKKLKLLEQGLGVIQNNIQKALQLHLKKAEVTINPIKSEKFKSDFWLNQIINDEVEHNEKVKNIVAKYSEYRYIDEESVKKINDNDMKELLSEIAKSITKRLKAMSDEPNNEEIQKIVGNLIGISNYGSDVIDVKTLDYLRTLRDFNLIIPEDITKPRYIFDRNSEIAKNTLGEAITGYNEYKGHWVDKEYLDTADFMQILGTWIHEVCHKSGGDGSAEFTYALTDILRVLLRAGSVPENSIKLSALEEIYNKL